MLHNSLMTSLNEGYLGCFQSFTVMNKPVISICVKVFLWTYVKNFCGKIQSSMIAYLHAENMLSAVKKIKVKMSFKVAISFFFSYTINK